MELSHNIKNRVCVLYIEGNLSLNALVKIKAYLEPLYSSFGLGIVVNCRQIDFMDSSGLGLLLSLFNLCKQKKLGFSLCCLTPPVDELLTNTQLKGVLQVHRTEESSLASLC